MRQARGHVRQGRGLVCQVRSHVRLERSYVRQDAALCAKDAAMTEDGRKLETEDRRTTEDIRAWNRKWDSIKGGTHSVRRRKLALQPDPQCVYWFPIPSGLFFIFPVVFNFQKH